MCHKCLWIHFEKNVYWLSLLATNLNDLRPAQWKKVKNYLSYLWTVRF